MDDHSVRHGEIEATQKQTDERLKSLEEGLKEFRRWKNVLIGAMLISGFVIAFGVDILKAYLKTQMG